jgi:glycosyltransferase involved in cell wall biosynthesis
VLKQKYVIMKVSIIVPSKGCKYLKYLLHGLRGQSTRPYEVIIVVKECDVKAVENLCGEFDLPGVIIEQKQGYFTHALNIGKKEARGDITIFTDGDVIPLRKWIERYIEMHRLYPSIAGISSRDIYVNLNGLKLMPTPDDKSVVRFYRWFIRPWLEPPHPITKRYRLGVYLTKKLNTAHGPLIPSRTCYSLPFRGVNMSFKTSCIYDVWFPEHRLLKRAPGNEQYFALQLLLKGLNTLYTPNNPVLHIARSESLSRTRSPHKIMWEFKVMRSLYGNLLQKHGIRV